MYRDDKVLYNKTQIEFSSILQSTGMIKSYIIKHRLSFLLTVYRDDKVLYNKTQIEFSSILQCIGMIKSYIIKHRLSFLLFYSV